MIDYNIVFGVSLMYSGGLLCSALVVNLRDLFKRQVTLSPLLLMLTGLVVTSTLIALARMLQGTQDTFGWALLFFPLMVAFGIGAIAQGLLQGRARDA
jgi:hypothetical protein